MRAAIYARVLTKDKGQDPENQLRELRTFAQQHGTSYNTYTDQEPVYLLWGAQWDCYYEDELHSAGR